MTIILNLLAQLDFINCIYYSIAENLHRDCPTRAQEAYFVKSATMKFWGLRFFFGQKLWIPEVQKCKKMSLHRCNNEIIYSIKNPPRVILTASLIFK